MSKTFLKPNSHFSHFPRQNNPNSVDFENHISWDYAEQVKLPYSSQQEV